MKRILYFAAPFLFTTMYSCSSNENAPTSEAKIVKEVRIEIEDMESEDVHSRMNVDFTDGIDYLWAQNDTIGIFPTEGGQVEFPITGDGIGTISATFNGGNWGLKEGRSYSAYYPFNYYNRDRTAVQVSYVGQEQDGTNYDHLSNYVVLASTLTTPVDGVLNFSMKHIGSVLTLHLTMPEPNTYIAATVYTDAKVFPVKKTINLMDSELTETVVEYSDRLTLNLKDVKTTTSNEVLKLRMAFPSVSEGTHTLKVAVYDKYGYAYTADLFKKDLETKATASFTRNYYQNRYASPVLTEGFNLGIGTWDTDENDNGGVVE